MTQTNYLLAFTVLLFNACQNPTSQSDNNTSIQTNTKTTEIQKANWIPKSSFGFESIHFNMDTLFIVTCSEFVYSPFGALDDKKDLSTSSLNNFNQQTKIQRMDIGEVEFQYLTLNLNRLILFFDKNDGGNKHSYVFKGELKDSSVSLINGIQVGVNKDDCMNAFFDNYESKLLNQVNVISLISCVDDIVHTYTFKNETLNSIDFKTDSYWNVNY
jgi:hypothetical protein